MLQLRHLPPELHALIVMSLPLPDVLRLRLTCRYFYGLIPQPSHDQLLLAESTDWARHRGIYTCRYCLRLRPAEQFADRMLQRRRSRSGRDSEKRFCIECGLRPREGTARYGPGAQITTHGRFFVYCLSCHHFQPGARDRLGRNTSECVSCWQGHNSQPGAPPEDHAMI
ncbi:uncharacterized protein N7459_007764 [Penicillium hispanicum]|uniref:uncharacterized protein n=1 Tax=Penicillium hispanicum TaxID=1080232 RepID=UPI002540F8B5|nr:uncharacterized protein N7459_007764 [Penicillium hispanicum]KAJ5578800.1 hypothetical protein N7459_007764 [Penicillium hispanicum]